MLVVEGVTKQYGGQVLFAGADLFIGPRDRIGLVGPNGIGKTTLLRLLAGDEQPDAGTVKLQSGATVGVLTQESQCRLGINVVEEMHTAFPEIDAARNAIDDLTAALEEGPAAREQLARLAEAQSALDFQQEHTLQARIGKVLHGLGFQAGDMYRLTDEFSGGWQMRIAMAKLLLRQPDLMLLDEPTNHLDRAAREWLCGYLSDYPRATLVISHDEKFLDRVVKRIVEIENKAFHSFTGNFTAYRRQKELLRTQQEAAFERQQRELERQQVFIDRFGAKNTKATAVKSREKMIERIEKVAPPPPPPRRITLAFPAAARPAKEALRLRHVSKLYGEEIVLLDIHLKIQRGQRVALLGENGSGKSTLLRLLAGLEPPSEGSIEVGRQVAIGYFAQHQAESLPATMSVLEAALEGLDTRPEGVARNILGRLLLQGEDAHKPVAVLSGGERSRLALARFLLRPANVLLLDEPTNHLDAGSRAVLMEALTGFEGSIVVASHDREMLHRVCTEAYEIVDGTLRETRLEEVKPRRRRG